ncbi:hypothetical protein [Phormidium sp. CCY1219]|uniref:hypothetical protein n=1 Tax=Phormidium sp. CCY1219 TaxID=2886104 RepID=UPI002D1F2277|nr:hypothetical protein [Phormidium sp. CCY1219]MEB3829525.1 hypothetical protein [Phormidium sp. CCY1219]
MFGLAVQLLYPGETIAPRLGDERAIAPSLECRRGAPMLPLPTALEKTLAIASMLW